MGHTVLPQNGFGERVGNGRTNDDSPDRKCLHTALRLLGRRDHSQSELCQKLRQRGFDASQIAGALSECRRLNYLNDERFCKIFISRLRLKGYGIQRIADVLRSKGLAADIIEAGLESCRDDEVQTADCRRALARKKGTRSGPLSATAKARLYRFLQQRGFSSFIVLKVLNEVEPGI
jgi:regulatory protein